MGNPRRNGTVGNHNYTKGEKRIRRSPADKDDARPRKPKPMTPRNVLIEYANSLAGSSPRVRDELVRVASTTSTDTHPVHGMQVILSARLLYQYGYRGMKAEVPKSDPLVNTLKADLFARKMMGGLREDIIVEVETGLGRNDRRLKKELTEEEYRHRQIKRFIGKMRYAPFTKRFFFAYPESAFDRRLYQDFTVPLIDFFASDPFIRQPGDIREIKRFVDQEYTNPPIPLDVIRNARLDGIFLTDVRSRRITLNHFTEYRGHDGTKELSLE